MSKNISTCDSRYLALSILKRHFSPCLHLPLLTSLSSSSTLLHLWICLFLRHFIRDKVTWEFTFWTGTFKKLQIFQIMIIHVWNLSFIQSVLSLLRKTQTIQNKAQIKHLQYMEMPVETLLCKHIFIYAYFYMHIYLYKIYMRMNYRNRQLFHIFTLHFIYYVLYFLPGH